MRTMQSALMATALLFCGTANSETTITIDDQGTIGTIAPEIYGQFLEHVGTQVYDGIWVGEHSEVQNTDGIRDDVLDALTKLDIPVIRWPGGCYADLYHWRDGVGPQSDRTARVNMAWGGTPEPNSFGTHEFFELAERLGAKTYLNVNLASGTVQEASDWLEYITFDGDSALANERRANGRDAAWRLDYLSIGNETWGCGGHMRPSHYADLYAQWATILKTGGEPPKKIISGSHEGNLDYSDQVLDHPDISNLSDGISLHYYTLPTGDWAKKGSALEFPKLEWASTLENTLKMETAITEFLDIIDARDLDPEFGLYVDEWGMWVDGEVGAPALYQQNTIRDAIVASWNLNIFHAHADRIAMTNIAQMVNVLQAMILTDGPDMVLTPTYHVYEMYRPFQGAQALAVSFTGPTFNVGDLTLPALSASAARNEIDEIIIALTNADPGKSHKVEIPALGYSKSEVRVLAGDKLDSHNSFSAPDVVHPTTIDSEISSGQLKLELPPRSISVIILSDK